MPASTASLESLSSPSPSPPPSKQRPTPPAQSAAPDTAGLDSGSELSELTEDEQDSAESNSKTSVRKQATRRTRRSLVPDEMWGWYKKKSEEKVTRVQDDADSVNRTINGRLAKGKDDEDEDDHARGDTQNDHHQPPLQQPTTGSAVPSTSNEDEDSNESRDPDVNNPDDTDHNSEDAGDDDEEEEQTDSEEEEDPADIDGDPQRSVAPSVDPAPVTPLVEDGIPMDVDILPLPTAAASSIMAGSTVIEALSPTSSASSSRSPSPAPTKAKTKEIKVVDAPAPLEDDADANPEEEDIDPELESELQPAHRAEALDVLATIELKFALLREKLYVEKMETLAWEESLLDTGRHPELIHLDEELSKRRDKRLELASLRRAFEVADVNKRKRVDEDAVWSWWKYERDELQTDMLAETNRKRRKLQRESRSLERPPPIRNIPNMQHELPPVPTLREITSRMAYAYAPGRMLAMTGAYPSLVMLSNMDVERDLDFLNHHRRGWDSQRGTGHIPNQPFEAYGPIEGSSGYGPLPLNASQAPPPVNSSTPHHHPPAFPAHGRQDPQAYPVSAPFPSRRSVSPPSANAAVKSHNGWMSGPGMVPNVPDDRNKDVRREEARSNKDERERDMERERNHQLQLIQQQHQRYQQQQQPSGPPGHHHSHHHHHVVHHHHHPPPGPPSNNISPRRVARDLEFSRPRSGPPAPTEIIELTSGTKRSSLTTSPIIPSNINAPHEPAGMPRLIDHLRPPSRSSVPDQLPQRLPPISTNLERIMTPFVIPPSQATQAHFSSTPSNDSNQNMRRDALVTDDLLRRPPSATHLPMPPSTVHSPSSMRPSSSNLGMLVRPQSRSQNTRLPLSLPLPSSRSPISHSTTPVPPMHAPPQPSPPTQSQSQSQTFPTPAALMAASNGVGPGGIQNRPTPPVSSPKPPVKQVIDPALTDISGPGVGPGGRSSLILNVVELRNPNPPSLHPSATLAGIAPDVLPAGRMNGVSVDGS